MDEVLFGYEWDTSLAALHLINLLGADRLAKVGGES